MKMFLLLAALLATPSGLMDGTPPAPRPATVDISAVRYLDCGNWVGSGFIIGDGILVTAMHVASGTQCTDVETGGALMVYKTDPKHDLALLTGPELPTDIPYIKISCGRFKANEPYLSYGITPYGAQRPIIRMNVIVASDQYSGPLDTIGGVSSPGLRLFDHVIAPGMSGGPVVDLEGRAHGLNNAGDNSSSMIWEFADGMLCK